jgi:uncharacterized membrane protein
MALLILGLVIFIGCHSLGMMPAWEVTLKGALGRPAYRGLYSLLSIAGLVAIVYGFADYRANEWVEIWSPPQALKHVNMLFVLVAFIALAASQAPRGYIKARLKHPMLVGIKAWAFGHLLANGDLGGMILFGAFLAWAVVDRISYRWRAAGPELPAPQVKWDVIAVIAGLIAYGAMLMLHPILIGVSVFG